jgi:excisionase family DNA binding protein
MDKLITKKELADRLGVSLPTVNSYMAEGLVYIKLGNKRRSKVLFRTSDVERWLESNTQSVA